MNIVTANTKEINNKLKFAPISIPNNKMNFLIRNAIKQDAPSILMLIKELALYEKAPHEVVVTLEELERDGFEKNPIYSCFVAEYNNKVIGIALYYIKYSTWKGKCIYLDDIIVNETYRNKGVGKSLFEAIVMTGKKMKVRKIEWQVLNWNEPAINFYKKFNTQFDEEWVNCKLVDDEIQNFKF